MDIKIFSIGGTIDKVYFDQKSEYQVGQPVIRDILEEANITFSYEIESLVGKDSLDMTDEDRAFIHEKINNETSDHILITHGTDTMVDTGRALKDIPGKTIVLTGSMQPARFKNSDAVFNIGVAVGAVQTLPPGVYIAMNGKILNPDTTRKNVAESRFEKISVK